MQIQKTFTRLGCDPTGNNLKLNDGADAARDITAVSSLETDSEVRFKVDLADLTPGAEQGKLDLYTLLDLKPGGRSELPDGTPGHTERPWEVALGVYDNQNASARTADGDNHPESVRGVHFDPQSKSVEFSVDKQLLRSQGWQDGQSMGVQVYTAKDFRPGVTDTATPDKPWNQGDLLKGALQTPGQVPPTPPPPPAPDPSHPKIYVSLHWHMHQPIYWPGQNIVETASNPGCTDNPINVVTWPDRVGGYTHYLADAVEHNSNLPHMGAQVSWSGSLTEDINTLAKNGIQFGTHWMDNYRQARRMQTSLGNPRLDFVGIGYHHPLMPLTTTGQPGEDRDMELQIKMQQDMVSKTFGGPASKGFFPPEQAFTERMIPVLKQTGHDWVLVDNYHIERDAQGYPWSPQEKVEPPNPADQRGPAQPQYVQESCQQNSTNPVSGLGLRPHYIQHVDPQSGQATTMVAVPAERSLGYDDSYGDRSPLPRLADLEKLNTDPKHPLLVVLAHDGDNFGASGSRYYNETMNWVQQNPDKVEATTVQDYLDRFPPDAGDVVHVEDGSWTGADMGNPEFGKWLGKPYNSQGQIDHVKGYSPDRNSWAVLVAAENRVQTADRLQAPTGLEAIESGQGNQTDQAWHYFLQGETSCYEYWDGQNEWDNKPTIASNLAVEQADKVIGEGTKDPVGPTLFVPQRYPYNPGGKDDEHLKEAAPRDFTVWTLGYDVSGIKRCELKWREAPAGADDLYEGSWSSAPMADRELETHTTVAPRYKAREYAAKVEGQANTTLQYYVEAEDGSGNVTRSPIQRVHVA